MDRPESGLIKWSPNTARDSFLHINLQHRVVQVYEPTGRARRGHFDWRKLSRHDDFPPPTTYDWSPSIPGLVAVGTSTGVVNLLRVDDNSNAYVELGLKMSRACQAVAFSTAGKLAVGLDRVRSDNCLYVWDVNRLAPAVGSAATARAAASGFPADMEPFLEPVDRLEPSVSVSSVKFFEDNPNVLVAGIKGQGLRIHDLREHANVSVQFQTKCCNNLAIDYADQNYFASSALDQPGIMVWDRRATQRQVAAPAYVDAVDQDDLPWGGALRLDSVVQVEAEPAMTDSKNAFIRSLRFCRDRAGLLAVLSRTGQLRVLSTKHEYTEPEMQLVGSPELLEVRTSYEMDPLSGGEAASRKKDKIVSFDWVTLNSPVLQPRLLVLRANGAFEILETPSFTAEYAFKLIPWQAPHRGLEEGGRYHEPIELEPSQSPGVLGPLVTEHLLSDVPLFGPTKTDVEPLVRKAYDAGTIEEVVFGDDAANQASPAQLSFADSLPIAQKLGILRNYAQEARLRDQQRQEEDGVSQPSSVALSQAEDKTASRQERRDRCLMEMRKTAGLSRRAEETLDHIMLLRAKDRYLFDYAVNQQVVADDPWLQDVWAWVAGAEDAATDGGMMSHPLDVGYMGVYTIWTHDLGSKPKARLSDGAAPPDVTGWERCLKAIGKKQGVAKFDGVETKWPHHREMCLEICNWGRANDAAFQEGHSTSSLRRESTWNTMAAADALFRGNTKEAVQILKRASTEHPELFFVSLALQLMEKNNGGVPTTAAEETPLDFDERLASRTDPYLRAISSIIATGDWATVANQRSLPLRDRVVVAVRNFPDGELTRWLAGEMAAARRTGDLEGIVLTGITDSLVDVLARQVQRFGDYQTATLLLSTCAPRFVDDVRAAAFRAAYRAYLQRHRAFFLRVRFEVESTKRSKHLGRLTLKPPARQIALRCVYCDAETSLLGQTGGGGGGGGGGGNRYSMLGSSGSGSYHQHGRGGAGGRRGGSSSSAGAANAEQQPNPFTEKMVGAGISCPNCKRHLPRCVVCLEVVGVPRSDDRWASEQQQQQGTGTGDAGAAAAVARLAARFPTFCLRCEHVLHLDHARQWFARHQECPAPECRCRCNFRGNNELNYL